MASTISVFFSAIFFMLMAFYIIYSQNETELSVVKRSSLRKRLDYCAPGCRREGEGVLWIRRPKKTKTLVACMSCCAREDRKTRVRHRGDSGWRQTFEMERMMPAMMFCSWMAFQSVKFANGETAARRYHGQPVHLLLLVPV